MNKNNENVMYQHQVDRILEKVELLNINLNPIIESSILQDIEITQQISLPDSFKVYLTKIQNGGASDLLNNKGPYYGIYSIAEAIEKNSEWEIDMKQDFQFTTDLELGDLNDAVQDLDKHIYRFENDKEYQLKVQSVVEEYNNTSVLAGSLFVCEYGCGDYLRLVVSGQCAGQIWVDSGVINGTGFYSLNVDILTFYENWLNRQIEILKDPSKKLINAWYSYLEFGNNSRYKIVP